jgi:hypothetical protein
MVSGQHKGRQQVEDETLQAAAKVGRTLVMIQLTEMFLDLLLRTAFRGDSPVTAEELERNTKFERDETLGQLIKQLHQRVEVHPELKSFLEKFLKDRNQFVHHLLDPADIDLAPEQVRQQLADFCEEISKSCRRLLELFMTILIKWKLSFDPNEPIDDETKADLEAAEKWNTTIDQLFRLRT